jgi:hypothetical protein
MAINYKLITAVSDASSPDTVFTATAVATHIKSIRIANESGGALTYHLAIYDNSASAEVPITVPGTSLPDDDVDVMDVALNLQNGDYVKLYSSGAGVKVAITLAENTDTAGATTSDDLAEGVTNLYMTTSERSKLSGIATGAEVNQNAFSSVAVAGQTTVAADTKTDTLTLIAGTNVTITTNATNDEVTINASGGASLTDTDDLPEGTTNLYFTTARVDSQIDVLVANAELVKSVNGEFPDGSGDVGFTTDAIPEGSTNLYFTTGRVDTQIDARITAGDIVTSVNAAVPSSTGAVTIDTDDVAEGTTNKYFTDARADDRIDLFADAAVVFGDTVEAQGAFKSASGVWAQNQGPLRMYEGTASGTNFVAWRAPATLAADVTFTMPGADGTSGQVLSTNGSAVTSWVTKKLTQVTGKTVATGAWSLVSGIYEASISDSAILSTSVVDVIPDNGSASTVRTAEVLPRTDSSTGAVKIYATNAPAATITVTLNIFDL